MMKRVGIVCELNPLHRGHRHLFDTLRRMGAEEIVCVMSEYFVQRCEPGLLPARDRAGAAVQSGADAVFSLPFPWSCGSAEYFSAAGMYLLQKLGCDTVAFGSESGELSRLQAEAAKSVKPLSGAEGTATAYDRLPPNDILATAYLRACHQLRWTPEIVPIQRIGAGHDTQDNASFSSTAARAILREGKLPVSLPEASLIAVQNALEAGACPSDLERFADILFTHWRLVDPTAANEFAECGGGVAERLHMAAENAADGADFLRLAATKKYTDARLRRAALYGFLRIDKALLKSYPAYTRVLACNEKGREILKYCGGADDFSIITNVRNLPKNAAVQAQTEAEKRADAFLSLLYPAGFRAGTFFSSGPVIL